MPRLRFRAHTVIGCIAFVLQVGGEEPVNLNPSKSSTTVPLIANL